MPSTFAGGVPAAPPLRPTWLAASLFRKPALLPSARQLVLALNQHACSAGSGNLRRPFRPYLLAPSRQQAA